MSRNFSYFDVSNVYLYKKIIIIPDNVIIEIKNNCVFIMGNLGKLTHTLHQSVDVQLNNLKYLNIYLKNYIVNGKSIIGTTKSLINGMIKGVTLGFIKKLQLVGIGYRASLEKSNNTLSLTVGLSHPVYYQIPHGITAQCFNQTEIILTGIDKQLIGQVAANLRSIRPPDPFKGKGIRYSNELIRNKETKKK